MKQKLAALLALLLLVAGWLQPISVRAAQSDPQVLQSRYLNDPGNYVGTIRYTYSQSGVLMEEIWEESGKTVFYDYSSNGILKNIYVDIDDQNIEMKKFSGDGSGWMLWEADGSGELNLTRDMQITLDSSGRPLTTTERRFYDDQTWGETHSYTYHDASAPEVGDRVFFGTYEQDNIPDNGQEPIEWTVLDQKGDQLLLLSVYALDSQRYHKENVGVTWKDSSLRSWLNDYFYSVAFYGAPKDQILETNTEAGGVRDKVFVLSLDEVNKYMPEKGQRCSFATDYAIAQGAYVDPVGRSWWLMRTSGSSSSYVMSTNCDGAIDLDGGRVASDRGTVRPAMWVRASAVTGQDAPVKTDVYTDYYITGETRVEHCRKTYEYDRNGNLLSLVQDLSDGMEVNYRTTYTYDAQGNVTQMEESYDTFTSLRTKVTTYSNTYNEKKQLIRIEEGFSEVTRTTGKLALRTPFKLTYITAFQYDASGNKIREETTFASGNPDYITTWQYDAQGNILKVTKNGTVIQQDTYGPLSKALWN